MPRKFPHPSSEMMTLLRASQHGIVGLEDTVVPSSKQPVLTPMALAVGGESVTVLLVAPMTL